MINYHRKGERRLRLDSTRRTQVEEKAQGKGLDEGRKRVNIGKRATRDKHARPVARDYFVSPALPAA
jgi:hypothetical protein